MSWQQPKLDWLSTDYFNVDDWLRVLNNLAYLGENLNVPIDIDTLYVKRGYAEIPYVETVNKLEEYINTLLTALEAELPEFVYTIKWYVRTSPKYSKNPSNSDWNRWESILLWIYNIVTYKNTYMYNIISGTCYSGSNRTLIRFSRGR